MTPGEVERIHRVNDAIGGDNDKAIEAIADLRAYCGKAWPQMLEEALRRYQKARRGECSVYCGVTNPMTSEKAAEDLEQPPLAWAVLHDGHTASIFPTREDAERNCDWHLKTFPHVRASVSPLYGSPKTHKETSEAQAAEANDAVGVQYDNVEICDALRDVAHMGDLSEEDRGVLYLAANVIEELRDRLGEEK